MTLKNMLDIVTEYSGFEHHCLFNTDGAIRFIEDVKNNAYSRVLVDLDYDPDGVLSGVKFYETLLDLGITNVDVYIPESKRHGVDDGTISKLREGYTHLIIVDSSTNSMTSLREISNLGVKVLLVDHHTPEFAMEDYPENVTIVNNKMSIKDAPVKELSAGFMSYLITTDIRKHFGLGRDKSHYVYGYITLISDVCELSTDYIKPIILDIRKYEPYIPRPVRLFMGNYDELNRSFVSYKFINKINSLCRSNRPDLLIKLFFELDKMECDEIQQLYNEIQDVYSIVSDKVARFSEQLHPFVEEVGSFILVDMSKAVSKTTLSNDYLINATGQFANNLSKHYNKPCICVMPMNRFTYKCSGRDCTGSIDLFELGQRFNLGGGGHKGSYGFTLPRYDLDELRMLLGTVSLTTNHDFAIDCDALSYVEFKHLISQVAMYNEVSGDKLCKLRLKRTLNSAFTIRDIGRLRIFSMRDIELKDFKQTAKLGDVVELEPVYSRKPYCIIQ